MRGYWLTDRTGLEVDGYAAFALVEGNMWKTLIVEGCQERFASWGGLA